MEDKDREIADLKARLSALEKPGAAPSKPPPPASPGAQAGCAIVLVIVGLVFFTMCSRSGDSASSSSTASSDTYPAVAAWTPPEGYTRQVTDRGDQLGVKWMTPNRSECTGSGVTCFGLSVVSEKGCPRNLYVSVTLLSKTGENIGWTNDTAQGVQAGEPVRLVFETYERGAATSRIAEVNCY